MATRRSPRRAATGAEDASEEPRLRHGPRPARRPPGYVPPRGRTTAAGRAFLVAICAFSIWLALDARQLYNSANASPLGVRRSVAMTLLRPIARLQEFFGADRVVDGANRALGRAVSTTPVLIDVGPRPRHHHPATHHHGRGANSSTTTTTTTLPYAFSQPTAQRPMTLLEVGDSIGEDLGFGLKDVVGPPPPVNVETAAQGSTGLADPAYYNWPAQLPALLNKYHPEVVVALYGGNDWQDFVGTGGREATRGTAFWRAQYSARVASIVNEVTEAGARLFWVGLPIMSPSSVLPGSIAPTLNSIYEAACSANPDCTYVSVYKLFEDSQGNYAQYLPDAHGNLVEVRDPDGIHIAPPAGNDRAASYVVQVIDQTLAIKL